VVPSAPLALQTRLPPPPESGTSLLEKLRVERDRETFAVLFRQYAPRIKQYLMGRGVAGGVADELVQEVMLTIWRKNDQFDPTRGSASQWIFAIVRSTFIDRVRRERRAEVIASDPLLEAVVDERPRPDEITNDTDLERAMSTLPPEQAEVLRRAYYGGLSLQEIALDDDVPLGTVKTRARLGLARLRHLFVTSPRGAETP
jgi:RNA polymerase sigma factor (sigma-70 family)